MDDPQMTPEQVTAHEAEFKQATEPVAPPELIAGKFKTQDDLLDAYKALEQKLGAPEVPVVPPVEVPEVNPADIPTGEIPTLGGADLPVTEAEGPTLEEYLNLVAVGSDDVTKEMRSQVLERHKLPDTTLSTLEQGSVSNYKNGVAAIYNAVGGKEQFDKLNEYVSATYTEVQIAGLDEAIKNPVTAKHTLDGLMREMGAATPTSLPNTQNVTAGSTRAYPSRAELQADMSNPIYTDSNHPQHTEFVKTVQDRFGMSAHLH